MDTGSGAGPKVFPSFTVGNEPNKSVIMCAASARCSVTATGKEKNVVGKVLFVCLFDMYFANVEELLA